MICPVRHCHQKQCECGADCPVVDDAEGWSSIGEAPIRAEDAELGNIEPDDKVDADEEDVVQPGAPLPEPRMPSPAEIARHNVTHLPYRCWCKHCVRARRQNAQHRSQSPSSQRTVPLLAADYAQARDCEDEALATLLIGRLYPAKQILAVPCAQKGIDDYVITQVAQFIKRSGYKHVVYKSDQEASIRAMFEEAFRRSHRQGECYNPNLQQMVPEASAVGESQSNGKAENAVQRIENMLCTYKSALEEHLGTRIPSRHPLINWMVEHTASVSNRHVCNDDGLTPYEAIHGQRSRGKLAEFGEKVFYYVPKRLRSKLDL